MRQVAPYPHALADVVSRAKYRPGWSFALADTGRHAGAYGLTLTISAQTVNSDAPAEPYTVTHCFWVPAESHNAASWQRWLFEKILLVEKHEAMEFFTVDGVRPYAPGHGGGHDPYHALTP
jgi:hypothetical protein